MLKGQRDLVLVRHLGASLQQQIMDDTMICFSRSTCLPITRSASKDAIPVAPPRGLFRGADHMIGTTEALLPPGNDEGPPERAPWAPVGGGCYRRGTTSARAGASTSPS